MAKQRANSQKKRRKKKYTGRDAAVSGTQVTRIRAPERSKFGEWWFDNRRRILGYSVGVLIVIIFYFFFSWLLGLIF